MRLTQKHFQLFKTECEKQLERLGLKSWKVYYEFKSLKDAFANTQWKYSGRVATITLAIDFPKPFNNLEAQIKQTALHECLEVLLASVSSMAGDRHYEQIDFDKEIHTVIRTLEKLL